MTARIDLEFITFINKEITLFYKIQYINKGRDIMNKILVLCLILMIAVISGCGMDDMTGNFAEEEDQGAVAIVNGEEISKGYFERQYNMISQRYTLYGIDFTKEQLLNDSFIPQLLLVQKAKDKGIEVTEEEVEEFVDAEMEKIQSQMTEEQLQEQLDKLNITFEQLREDNIHSYRTQLYIQRLLNETAWQRAEVTEEEVEDYYEENKDQFVIPAQVKASHILVEDEETAEDIVRKINKGKNFSELAEKFSTDTGSAPAGGDLGYFGKGQMVPEFEEAAFALDIGEVSDIVESQFGYHIIKVTDKAEESQAGFDEVKDSIKNQLLTEKRQKEEEKMISRLRTKADIEILLDQESEPSSASDEEQTEENTEPEIIIE